MTEMHFDILTLFPEMINPYLETSMLKRAVEKGIFTYKSRQIREHAIDEYGHVDDRLYGGGTGMLMLAEPIWQSYQDCIKERSELDPAKRRTIYLSPKGAVFTQEKAKELLRYEHIIFLCGHYEGVDQRILDEAADEEISLGDFVLTGGELPALIIIDAVARMLPGVLPDKSAYENDSHYRGRLEERQYTRPPEWHGMGVPEVLREGHHAKTEAWKQLDGLNETLIKRPDLFDRSLLSEDEIKALLRYRETL